jgi:hypothetical protein
MAFGCASFSHNIILVHLRFKGDGDVLVHLDIVYLLSLDKGMLYT